MCTCLDFKTNDFYFGRTLDLEYRYSEQVCITPREYLFKLKNNEVLKTKYALIGMATVIDKYPLYYEACNENGLAMAGLNFPKTCVYFDEKDDKYNLTPFELIPYILGTFSTVKEVKEFLKNINISNISFMDNFPLSPLHWMVSDKDESIVIEQTNEGLKVYDNYVGVMTNNPDFKYQLTNLTNYMNLSSSYKVNNFSEKLDLNPYGVGMGAIGLPGDFSPTSRFVKTCFLKFNSICNDDEESSVSQFFHILDSVSMVSGACLTKDNKCDITAYTSCINVTKKIYYYKTYNNNQITAIKLNEDCINSLNLTLYNLREKQNIYFE